MNVVLSRDAEKQYNHLPRLDQVKIRKRLKILEENPYDGKKLSGELKGIRSLRAWPYRILYQINQTGDRVEILKIAHRQGVYK